MLQKPCRVTPLPRCENTPSSTMQSAASTFSHLANTCCVPWDRVVGVQSSWLRTGDSARRNRRRLPPWTTANRPSLKPQLWIYLCCSKMHACNCWTPCGRYARSALLHAVQGSAPAVQIPGNKALYIDPSIMDGLRILFDKGFNDFTVRCRAFVSAAHNAHRTLLCRRPTCDS